MPVEVYELPNGKKLHVSTHQNGDRWACMEYDHGAFCRRCVPVSEIEWSLLENVFDGRMEIVEQKPGEGFVYRLTDEGRRYVEQMPHGDPDA